MAFEVGAGLARIFGPPSLRRPYTRVARSSLGLIDRPDIRPAVRRGTVPIRPPGVREEGTGALAPTVVAPPQVQQPAQPAVAAHPAPAAPPGLLPDNLVAYIQGRLRPSSNDG
jgi:hypothetical protein